MPSATVEKLMDAAAQAADAGPAAEAAAAPLVASTLSSAARAARLINEQLVAFTRKNVEDQFAAMGAFARVKTPQEFWSLQAHLASASMAQYAAQLSTLTDTMAAATNEAARPFREAVNVALRSAAPSA